ncbi:serine/threonine-protein kinase [Frankia gtarii]|uniref:serine/threonine-protein kinase n=1 Tax=Frankia gtarii TaxID=2950102 RepID=UPI0021C1DF26|nr:serine/threonine-protein kinase [Frankia gtarii]
MSEHEGPIIDGYRSLRPIAQGGFSIVYTAYQDKLDRTVAVKVINADLLDAAAARRFARECRATGRLTGHPNIITVFEVGSARDRRPFIAMQYLPAGSMSDRLRREGPLGVAETLRVAAQIADALHAAHSLQILHRDVKPGNIMLSDRGDPVLSDFGIATLGLGTERSGTDGAFTVAFTAPEVLQGSRATVASDLYGLGATIHMLLAGTPPFGWLPGDSTPVMILRILHEEIRPLHRADVPDEVERALHTLMSRDPSRRPGSAAEAAAELRRLNALLGLTVRQAPPRPLGEPAPPPASTGIRPGSAGRDGVGAAYADATPPSPDDAPAAVLPGHAPSPVDRAVPAAPATGTTAPAAGSPAGPVRSPPAPPRPTAAAAAAGRLKDLLATDHRPAQPKPAEPGIAAQGTTNPRIPEPGAAEPGISRPIRRVPLLLLVPAVVFGVLLVILVAAIIASRNDQPGADVATTATSTVPPNTVAAALPHRLQVADHGAVAILTWQNGSPSNSLVLQRRSSGEDGRLTPLSDGQTVYSDEIDPTRPYCYRIGQVLGVYRVEGAPPKTTIAWSGYTCIRNATPPVS